MSFYLLLLFCRKGSDMNPKAKRQPRIAVLVSGSGTILEAMLAEGLPIVYVMADRECRGIQIAEQAGIETKIIDRAKHGWRQGCGDDWDRYGFTRKILDCINEEKIGLVALAGFMTILDGVINEPVVGRVINIHPAYDIERFPGAHAVRDQIAAGVEVSGSTIHLVTGRVDDPRYILYQVQIPVLPDDTEESLQGRIKKYERVMYPDVLWNIARGHIVPLAPYLYP